MTDEAWGIVKVAAEVVKTWRAMGAGASYDDMSAALEALESAVDREDGRVQHAGIDAAKNLHVHVNGVCYTNEQIAKIWRRPDGPLTDPLEDAAMAACDADILFSQKPSKKTRQQFYDRMAELRTALVNRGVAR